MLGPACAAGSRGLGVDIANLLVHEASRVYLTKTKYLLVLVQELGGNWSQLSEASISRQLAELESGASMANQWETDAAPEHFLFLDFGMEAAACL